MPHVTSIRHTLAHPPARKNLLFVRLETDDGIYGWGECYTQSDRDRAIEVHVEELARGERDDVLMVLRDADDACRGVVPPLLRQEKALIDGRKGLLLPRISIESLILRQRFDASLAVRIRRGA